MRTFNKLFIALSLIGLSAGAAKTSAQTWDISATSDDHVIAMLSGSSPHYILAISGTGAMKDFTWDSNTSSTTAPWFNIRNNIATLVIHTGVTTIGDYAFSDCSHFTGALTIPNSVTSIGYDAFTDCNSFTGALTIPNSVTFIGMFAFMSCSGFTALTIPNSVTTIGSYAFSDCSGLTSITCRKSPPPVPALGDYVFEGVSNSIPVYVLCNMPSFFENSDWADYFTNFQETPPIITVQSNDETMGSASVIQQPGECTHRQAQIEATANSGYQFLKWSDDNTDNPRTLTPTHDITLVAIFESLSGIDNVETPNLKLYPNPVQDELEIESGELRVENYSIVNMAGQVVMHGKLQNETTAINVSALPSGIYFLKAENRTGKFVKE